MEIVIRDGKILKKPTGLPLDATGLEALLQRAYNLAALKYGAFCYDRTLGSLLADLDTAEEHAAERALRCAQAALLRYPELDAVNAVLRDGQCVIEIQTPLGTGEIAVKGGA